MTKKSVFVSKWDYNHGIHSDPTWLFAISEPERTTTLKPIPTTAEPSNCEKSAYGCCPDGFTSALGPKHGGCPSLCNCNKLGSVEETCDPSTQECRCRTGVGGPKCDRCLPGYWGLHRIGMEGKEGCMGCGCSKFGSVREDCEQMSGRCVVRENKKPIFCI
ncbi:Agrin [Orchesella cincta]|uniref:Agrin n=1 Tax=Orchesella cincta TaxID=48709 RepID=A0A1D2NDR9_ORCCI|nr:Agrin [Orchesella cincta]